MPNAGSTANTDFHAVCKNLYTEKFSDGLYLNRKDCKMIKLTTNKGVITLELDHEKSPDYCRQLRTIR